MDPQDQIQQLLRVAGQGRVSSWPIILDVLEEHGWDLQLLEFVAERMDGIGLQMLHPPVDFVVQVFGKLAETNYPAAVQAHVALSSEGRTGDPYGSYDSRARSQVIDAINTSRCGADWEAKNTHEQMEIVTGETGGDLEPWEVWTGGAEGPKSRRRRWTIDFAPEWMERELEREFPGASFKTVWYSDGGNFGPSFDEILHDEEGTWRQVRNWAAGREEACPYAYGEDAETPRVTVEHTYCGTDPGKRCALCDEAVDAEHGIVYMGELGGAVFVLDVACDVTRLEIREETNPFADDMRWEIVAFAGEEEVDVPEVTDGYWPSLSDAESMIHHHTGTQVGDLPPGIPVTVFPDN